MNKDKQRFVTVMTTMLIAACAISLQNKAHATDQSLPQAEQQVRSFIDEQLKHLNANFPGKIEVTIGTHPSNGNSGQPNRDPRPGLAACQQIEPFLPPGARLWGRGHIGLRCRQGANWTTYLPIEVRIHGPALVAIRPLTAGTTIGADDIRVDEIELTREPVGTANDPIQVEGKVLTRAVTPGTPLRPEWLRAKTVITAGDNVKVLYMGEGFSIAADGRALANATDGQSIRVQVDSGKVLSGTARDGRRVEVR